MRIEHNAPGVFRRYISFPIKKPHNSSAVSLAQRSLWLFIFQALGLSYLKYRTNEIIPPHQSSPADAEGEPMNRAAYSAGSEILDFISASQWQIAKSDRFPVFGRTSVISLRRLIL